MLYKRKLTCRGTPNEKSVQACACTVLNYMIDTMGIGNNQIILYLFHSPLNSSYGHSLGSAVSAYLAVYASKTRSRGVAGVVLQVLSSLSPHLQSCFMSISYSFHLRFSVDQGHQQPRHVHPRHVRLRRALVPSEGALHARSGGSAVQVSVCGGSGWHTSDVARRRS